MTTLRLCRGIAVPAASVADVTSAIRRDSLNEKVDTSQPRSISTKCHSNILPCIIVETSMGHHGL